MKKKKIQGIDGFEELFEDYLKSDEYLTTSRKEQDKARGNEPYELQTFLEQENARITCIETFLTKKIPSRTKFSQTEQLLIQQIERKKELLENNVPIIAKLNSIFQQNMAQLFNSHFS